METIKLTRQTLDRLSIEARRIAEEAKSDAFEDCSACSGLGGLDKDFEPTDDTDDFVYVCPECNGVGRLRKNN